MQGTPESIELPATLTCSGSTAWCQCPLRVTYTTIIKKNEIKELAPIEILANVITGKGKYYVALTCFPKLWRLRKINNSGDQQSSIACSSLGQEQRCTKKLSTDEYIYLLCIMFCSLPAASELQHPRVAQGRSNPGPVWGTAGLSCGGKLSLSPIAPVVPKELKLLQPSCHGCKAVMLTFHTPYPCLKQADCSSEKKTKNLDMSRLRAEIKIPTTCSLLAPTCLYGCDCWVTAAQPHNTHQKCQLSHARGLGCVLHASGSQAREDMEHAKFKVNSRETSEATSCCWERPCDFFLFVPVLHGLLLTGWRLLYTIASVRLGSRQGTK